MAQNTNYIWYQYADGILVIQMQPPTNIGGQEFVFKVANRFGSEAPFLTKSTASGYGAGQSGITVFNSGQGTLNIRLNAVDFSGRDPINYATWTNRQDSGQQTPVTRGFLTLRL